MKIPVHTRQAIKQHAIDCWPKESCGLIINGEYHPKTNTWVPDPDKPEEKEGFDIPAEEYPLDGYDALIHSHPYECIINDPDWTSEEQHNNILTPSKFDMEYQISSAKPWGIVSVGKDSSDQLVTSEILFFGDSLEPPPLLQRPFRSGPSGSDGRGDCYALIRDWYKIERGIRIKEFPRDHLWYTEKEHAGNMYLENFENAGFVRISFDELEIGDVILMSVRSLEPGMVNHGGVYIGNGLILHHLQRRCSLRDPFMRWQKHITHYLRYEG